MCRLLLVAAAILLPVSLSAQISPGPLARAHQLLEGPTNCTTCHGRAAEAMPKLCLTCHREIGWLKAGARGLHANAAVMGSKTCGTCHPDHAGRDFDLIEWAAGEEAQFDHRRAGWPLEGKHRQVACLDCHRTEFRGGPAAVRAPAPRHGPGWTGLETTCVSCHRRDDPHDNALGNNCARCHDVRDWAPAPGFDHADSRYPLTGAHQQVDCATCHLAKSLDIASGPDGTRVPRYRPLPFADCASCHADPHRGRLPGTCSSCHVTRGFNVIDPRGFNHTATRYPLLGKHRSTGCEACHGSNMATPRPAFGTCATCHADVHEGAGFSEGSKLDCSACHREQGFRPATFTLAQHQETAFVLQGQHTTVPCAQCHKSTTSVSTGNLTVPLKMTVTGCNSCHADPHGGQLKSATCTSCHSDAGWARVRFDSGEHARTGFVLDGAHATITCARCHGPERPGLPPLGPGREDGSAGIRFQVPEVSCAACHGDPHPSSAADSLSCSACHGTTSFRPAQVGVAEHGAFTFVLDGAHRAVACVNCHTGLSTSDTVWRAGATLIGAAASMPVIDLHAAQGTTCAGCHVTPHGDQFTSRADHGACETCHVTASFTDTLRFDHARNSTFPLTGAHATVACARCHRTEVSENGPRTTYRPIAHRCEDCHRDQREGQGQ